MNILYEPSHVHIVRQELKKPGELLNVFNRINDPMAELTEPQTQCTNVPFAPTARDNVLKNA